MQARTRRPPGYRDDSVGNPLGEAHGKTVRPLICESKAMHGVAERIERAAQADCPVLICGEPGTGKKLVAETIHRQSRRGHRPLVIIHAASSTGRSAEKELFGTPEHPGRLAAATAGAVLIDEITALARTTQAKLLEAVESGPAARFEHGDQRPFDFRLMATTRHEPSKSVEQGAVREDLYYRLAVVTIRVPSLRERRADIPCLVRHFLAARCAGARHAVPDLEPELMAYLVDHPWPGNGRQLRKCVEAMLPEDGAAVLGMNHLPASLIEPERHSQAVPAEGKIDTLADLQRLAVLRALKAHQGNRTQAAKALGISVRTLQRKLRQWGM